MNNNNPSMRMYGNLSKLSVIIEEEEEEEQRLRDLVNGALQMGATTRKRVLDRGRLEGARRLHLDYFAAESVYPADMFRRRFRMSPELFQRIVSGVVSVDEYFVQRRDAAHKLGFSPEQKAVGALRMIAYGVGADSLDEYVRMGETTALECVKRFASAVIDAFGDEYLRSPNAEDIARLLKENEERGFPGMLGSLDYMHWQWKNCPKAWHGQFKGRSKIPTLILEAVASRDTWICVVD